MVFPLSVTYQFLVNCGTGLGDPELADNQSESAHSIDMGSRSIFRLNITGRGSPKES